MKLLQRMRILEDKGGEFAQRKLKDLKFIGGWLLGGTAGSGQECLRGSTVQKLKDLKFIGERRGRLAFLRLWGIGIGVVQALDEGGGSAHGGTARFCCWLASFHVCANTCAGTDGDFIHASQARSTLLELVLNGLLQPRNRCVSGVVGGVGGCGHGGGCAWRGPPGAGGCMALCLLT